MCPAKLATIEYDPNRSARIGLLHYADGEKRYILVPHGLQVGDTVIAGERAEARVGNALPLRNIPLGTQLHNIELIPGRGGQIVRSAGTSAQLMAKEGTHALVRLPSGEVRRVDVRCMATVGQVGNIDHENQSLGKAGRARHMGQRPEVRGVVMNPQGPSPRRWRRQVADGHAAQDPLGSAGHGSPHPHQQEHREAHRDLPSPQVGRRSVMSRSLKKGPYVEQRLLARVQTMNRNSEKQVLKTWSRASVIFPDFIGHTVAVYNGRKHVPVFISENMVGHRLGEFAPTRNYRGHGRHTERSTSLK